MSKYGFDEKELRKTIVTMIDKDGFHRDTISVNEKNTDSISVERGMSIRAVDNQTRILHEFGISRMLKEDEDLFICKSDDVDEKYGLKRLEYIPDVAHIVCEEGPIVSETSLFDDSSYSFFVQFYVSRGVNLSTFDYLFIYKKDTGKIVGTNYPPNVILSLKKLISVSSSGLSSGLDFKTAAEEGSGISVDMNTPVLLSERFVLVHADGDYGVEKLSAGDNLPEVYSETVVNTEELGGRYYYFWPAENHGFEKNQGVWVTLVNDQNIVVDCLKSKVSIV